MQPSALTDIEEVAEGSRCTVCDPMEEGPGTIEVTSYPMGKIRKKAREEETAMCILEWRLQKRIRCTTRSS
jgi:hypothetical protein